MKIGNIVRTAGISRAIVTAVLENTIQIDNDPDWIPFADAEIIGEATPQDWIALLMVKQVEVKRLDTKLGELIIKQGKHESLTRDLNEKIAAQDRAIITAEDRGRKSAQSRIDELERRIMSLEKSLREAADANQQARTKLAALENEVKPGDPDIKILTFFDDPIYRESTLQVERHLSEGARLIDLTIAPVSSMVDGQPVSRLCRVFTLQKRIAKPSAQPAASAAAILTADYVEESCGTPDPESVQRGQAEVIYHTASEQKPITLGPIAQHIARHGADDAIALMDAVAAQKIRSAIAQTMAQSSTLLTTRPLLSSPIQ